MGHPPSAPHGKPQPRKTSAGLARQPGSQALTSVLCDVAHPGEGLVATLLNDLQVAHLDTRALIVLYPTSTPHLRGKARGAGLAQQEGLRSMGGAAEQEGLLAFPLVTLTFAGDQDVSFNHALSEGPQGNRPHARMRVWGFCCDSGVTCRRQPALAHSYLDARGSEIGDLELDTDGRLALLVFGFHTGKTKVGPHQVLLATLGSQCRRQLGNCPAVWPITNVLSPRLGGL